MLHFFLSFFLLQFFCATVDPIFSVLEYLCLPVQLPSIQAMAEKVLGANSNIDDNANQLKLIEVMEKEYHSQLAECPYGPYHEVLEAFAQPLLMEWDNVFSSNLSAFMHLLGRAEEAESSLYMHHYDAYSKEIVRQTERIVEQGIADLTPGDITSPVLKNMIVKLHWFFLGFHPTNEPRVALAMPYPIFTELVMQTIMSNWNTTAVRVSQRSNGEEINFGETLIEVSD